VCCGQKPKSGETRCDRRRLVELVAFLKLLEMTSETNHDIVLSCFSSCEKHSNKHLKKRNVSRRFYPFILRAIRSRKRLWEYRKTCQTKYRSRAQSGRDARAKIESFLPSERIVHLRRQRPLSYYSYGFIYCAGAFVKT